MHRLTISVDDPLAEQFERWMRRHGYGNRSEAFRDLLRRSLEEDRVRTGAAPYCIACLSFVYNHHERQLASRIADIQHAHHDVSVASTHVHLDHDDCMETAILRGATIAVTALANAIMAQTGVRHGQLNLVPMAVSGHHHHDGHAHQHLHPVT